MEAAVKTAIRDIIDRMLAVGGQRDHHVETDDTGLVTAIDGRFADFQNRAMRPFAFEQLAKDIEGRIAFDRARDMVAAAPPPDDLWPLWLVSGSSILARWLTWSRNGKALQRELVLLKGAQAAPIAGILEKRSRRELGQGGVKIRVRFGQAVAESIELSDEPRAIAVLGQQAHIRIIGNALPETVLLAAQKHFPGRNDRDRLADLVSHPFLDAADVELIGIRNDGKDAIFEIATTWEPLEPIPAAARAVVPRDADPVSAWRATATEKGELDRLINLGRAVGST